MESIVGINPDWRNSEVFIYTRGGRETLGFMPFILGNSSLEKIVKTQKIKLSTEGAKAIGIDESQLYDMLFLFDSPQAMGAAHTSLSKRGYPVYDWMHPITQLQARKGLNFYSGMGFHDLKRMQVYYSGIFELRTPEGEMMRLSPDSPTLIEDFSKAVMESDPDLIESYGMEESMGRLIDIADAKKKWLGIGREGEFPAYVRRKMAGYFDQLTHRGRVHIPGRQSIDLFQTAYRINMQKRRFRDFRLSTVSDYLGIGYGEPVQQIDLISQSMLPAVFDLASQLLHLSPEEINWRGNAALINFDIIGKYLHDGMAIPMRSDFRQIEGGYVDIFHEGFVPQGVFDADITAMYPTLMINENIKPERDYRDEFIKTLKKLAVKRQEAKKERDKYVKGSLPYKILDMKQVWIKTDANTCYGYMMTPHYPLGDSNQAEKLTSRGREMLKGMIEFVNNNGHVRKRQVFQANTDGFTFSGDPDLSDLKQTLPVYINLDIQGPYSLMLIANNNYMLSNGSEVIIKGGGLTGKSLPRFITDFIREAAPYFMDGDIPAVMDRYALYSQKVINGMLGIEDIMVIQEIKQSKEIYLNKRDRRKMPHMELYLMHEDDFRQGDFISYYVARSNPKLPLYQRVELAKNFPELRYDENYYMGELRKKLKYAFHLPHQESF